jgi:hypothetical protein
MLQESVTIFMFTDWIWDIRDIITDSKFFEDNLPHPNKNNKNNTGNVGIT